MIWALGRSEWEAPSCGPGDQGRSLASLLSKGHQKFVTGAHYKLATTSPKFREQITKFQGKVPKAARAWTMASLAAARRKGMSLVIVILEIK